MLNAAQMIQTALGFFRKVTGIAPVINPVDGAVVVEAPVKKRKVRFSDTLKAHYDAVAFEKWKAKQYKNKRG